MKRGRKASGAAIPPAERQRQYRLRQKAAAAAAATRAEVWHAFTSADVKQSDIPALLRLAVRLEHQYPGELMHVIELLQQPRVTKQRPRIATAPRISEEPRPDQSTIPRQPIRFPDDAEADPPARPIPRQPIRFPDDL